MGSLQLLISIVLGIILIGAVDLSLGEQTEGIPFFNDSGEITLPRESAKELQESMPELKVYPLPGSPQLLPPLGGSIETPLLGN